MKEYQLIEIVEAMFPQLQELTFDGSGTIKLVGREIQKVGVCVDVTSHVASEVSRQGIDYLIVHHPNGTDEKLISAAKCIGAYGLHLALDTAPEGLIDSFADLFGFESLAPIAFEYHGNVVQNGAVLGILPSQQPLSYFDLRLREAGLSIQEAVYAPGRNVQTVAVSTGPAIRTDFLRQVKPYNAELFIAGSIKKDADQFAKANDMQFLAVGDYDSHSVGMKKFTETLDTVFRIFGATAVLLPNEP